MVCGTGGRHLAMSASCAAGWGAYLYPFYSQMAKVEPGETVRKGSERPPAKPYGPFARPFVLRIPAKSTLQALLEHLFGQSLEVAFSEVAAYAHSRTMVTGQWACLTTESDTLPSSALLILPRPLLPITIKPVPISCANSRISSSARPNLRCASLTVPPASSILLTCSSSSFCASRSSCTGSSSVAAKIVGTNSPT